MGLLSASLPVKAAKETTLAGGEETDAWLGAAKTGLDKADEKVQALASDKFFYSSTHARQIPNVLLSGNTAERFVNVPTGKTFAVPWLPLRLSRI